MAVSASPQTLQQIAAHARAGRLDAAATLAASAWVAHAGDPVLAGLAGAVEMHRGQYARAADYLTAALRARPDDIAARANLAECLFRTGRTAETLQLCDAQSARADRSLRLARLGGALAQEAGDAPRAIELYRIVVAEQPEDWSTWNNLGNALSDVGDHHAATAALKKALALAPDSQPIRVNLGNSLMEVGEVNEAETLLRDAALAVPEDPAPLLALHGLYRRAGYDTAAFEALRDAAGRAPQDAALQSEFGLEAARINLYEDAERAYETSIAIDNGHAPAYVGLASVYERVNREADLEPLRARAIAAGIDGPPIDFIDALRLKRAGRNDDALVALERAGDVVSGAWREHLRGLMLDRLGRYDEAFEAFEAMNAFWRDDPSDPTGRAAKYRGGVAANTAILTADWVRTWTPLYPEPGDYPAPIFLGGFPRSGTTLLDTMLMTDPTTVVLEEQPFIVEIEQELGGLAGMAQADAAVLAAARARYFERVAAHTRLTPGMVIVDKQPLHTNQAAAIHRLFPEARFVLAMRHPCDVLLSCFLTNFRTNNAMSSFLDLRDAASLYDLTFSHWERTLALFDLPVRTVVYERLVEDTARELRPLFDWLGLAWPEEGLDHREAARARGMVSTASYAQVVEPVYQRSAGRWKRYERHLAPIFDTIRPWVDRFGYSLDDGRVPEWPASAETASA